MWFRLFLILHIIFGKLLGLENVDPDRRPNILLVLADDLGFNDLDWKDTNLYTPNLRELAFHTNTVQLNNSYVNHLCTPTRASLMSGYYPFRSGTQNRVFLPLEERGVSLEFPFLPENLRRLGYKNYMIGKWHLGYCKKEFLPTKRGFDSFYGFYGAKEGYFNHSTETLDPKTKNFVSGLDLFYEIDGVSTPDFDKDEIYSPILFGDETIDVLKRHEKEHPFFLYLAFQSVHVPLEVPTYYEEFCEKVKNIRKRYVYCAMLAAMDETIGRVVEYLKKLNFYENTIIIFTSDNGGDTEAGASNYPLRGRKGSVYEGGTKTNTFVHAPRFIREFGVREELFHVVDWYATILGMTGYSADIYGDGLNQWAMITTGQSDVKRTRLVYNIYPPLAAIRQNNFKLVYEIFNDELIDNGRVWLYDLREDPTETKDIKRNHTKLVRQLTDRIISYNKNFGKTIDTSAVNSNGNPEILNGAFTSGWCE